ncbi:MAG TPA: proton-conducting transporter membrane subunit [Acetobacteraceae bacterium]|nr:proton-conducting transporter membrane subunit [Acetobacteraceae bacterium]
MALEGAAAIVAALLVAGVVGFALPRPLRHLIAQVSVGLCAVGAALAFAALLAPGVAAPLAVPIGLPGSGMTLALDGLSALFLLLVFAVGAVTALYAADDRAPTAPLLPVFIAGMALTLLAGDAFALVLGFELMSLASWGLVLTSGERPETRSAALLYLGMASVGAACLIPALLLLAPVAGGLPDLQFAAMRAAPPEGWRAALVLVLVLLGAGSKAGLVPLHVWLPLAHPAAPSHVSALMSGAMTKVALYVVIRVLFDLCGAGHAAGWGVPLLVLGTFSAVLGALRATQEADLKSVLAASTVENIGLIAAALGLALMARSVDLPAVAALALGAALLHVLNHGVFKTLLFLGAGAAQHGAGTRRLDRLGGLVHRMPLTTIAMLAGAASLAGVPPAAGFASEWMLFQSVLAASRIGGLALQTVVTIVAALLALAVALAAAAAVRLIGIGFLGRPRTPRTAAADEAPPRVRRLLLGLAALSAAMGLLPGPILTLTAPALQALLGTGWEGRIGPLAIAPAGEGPGYSAIGIALLLAVALLLVRVALRRGSVQEERRGPAWNCGFAAPPDWLPFGDPLTQYGAAGFAQPLRRVLGTPLLGAREVVDMPLPGETRAARLAVRERDPAETWLHMPLLRLRGALSKQADRLQFLTIRRTLVVIFAALVVFLAVIAWLEAS